MSAAGPSDFSLVQIISYVFIICLIPEDVFMCSIGSVCGTWYCMIQVYVGSALRWEQSQILVFSGPLVLIFEMALSNL